MSSGPGGPAAAVHLTPTEWRLVDTLARRPGQLVRQQELLHQVWGPAYARETNYLRVYLAQLRRKLEDEPSQPAALHHRTRRRLPLHAVNENAP